MSSASILPDPRALENRGSVDDLRRAAATGATLAERARAREITGPELGEALRAVGEHAGIDLRGASLDGADLTGLHLFKANLEGASLRGADLSGAELTGANLTSADLERAVLVGTGLGHARLHDAQAFEADFTNATLTGTDLSHTTLHCAKLAGARVREADLSDADLRGADLRGAQLSLTAVPGASFDDADLRGARLRAIAGFETASWYGVDIRDINFAGAYRLRRHIVDENYLREFKEGGPVQHAVYWFWWVTSDCGRSLGRWMANIFLVAAAFAGLFSMVGLQTGVHERSPLTFLYYSVVTLTSLGYGDIVPSSSLGQVLVMLEVCVGYMMLGGLISILANKMARRAE